MTPTTRDMIKAVQDDPSASDWLIGVLAFERDVADVQYDLDVLMDLVDAWEQDVLAMSPSA